ncbi:hypothetical protein [Haloferula sargassicola]|uniref:Uncharacterized protein n=1 Tax=Haloferula sargassicola TaxID=490096 RepID=A0ABP9UNF6_9BACT
MILAFDVSDLPGDAIGLLVIVILTLLSGLKDKIFPKKDADEESVFTDEEREIIWRRQVETLPPPMPWQPPAAPKPEPVVAASKPPMLPEVREPSREELQLARAFEIRTRRRGRSSHRAEIDRLLRSPRAARNAMLLTEILGPPAALKPQPFETFPD